jgi:hypothetical protein
MMAIRFVPVHRAMPGVQDWLRARLGKEPIRKGQEREAYWLPDGRVIPADEWGDLTPFEQWYGMPVRAVVLEFEDDAGAQDS